jgi:hypothetical protein
VNDGKSHGPVENYNARFEDSLTNYVAGEVCVVVSADRVDSAFDLYQRVRHALNGSLTDCLHGPPAGHSASQLLARQRAADRLTDALARDLAHDELVAWSARLRTRATGPGPVHDDRRSASPHVGAAIEILRPITRTGPQREPFIVLPRKGRPSTVLCFFALNDAVDPTDLRLVRQLVNCANRHVVGKDGAGAAADEFRIVAATPNWLSIAAPQHGCGSPAGPPEAVPNDRSPEKPVGLFRLIASVGEAVHSQLADTGEVVVAILDTSPTRDAVLAAADPADPRSNWLLREVAETVHLDGALSLGPGHFDFLSRTTPQPVLPNLHGPEVEASGPPLNPHTFGMADHGLFAAGIVRHLAPSAEIHLIRVLGNEGVGDLHAIVSTLNALPAHCRLGPGRRLVVSLSLGADIPVGERLLFRWFPNSHRDLTTLRRHWADLSAVTAPIDQALAEAIAALDEQGVVLVAAAGNDAFTLPAGRKDPRYPAHYENVLGVTATKRSGQLADYANLGEEAAFDDENGIAAYGGNASLSGSPGSGPPRIDVNADPVDAVVGIFSAPSFPTLSGAPRTNVNGWAYWSGTSFATPIVSGFAAYLWRQHPELDNHQIVKKVLASAVAPAGPASAGYPDVPVLPVAPM